MENPKRINEEEFALSIFEKGAIIIARLVPTPEAYEGKTKADIEREILEEAPIIPYVAEIEKVTVVDVSYPPRVSSQNTR